MMTKRVTKTGTINLTKSSTKQKCNGFTYSLISLFKKVIAMKRLD